MYKVRVFDKHVNTLPEVSFFETLEDASKFASTFDKSDYQTVIEY
jgi:hypothetical protein